MRIVEAPRAARAVSQARPAGSDDVAAPIREALAVRERISIAEYERIMQLTAPLELPPAPGDVRVTGVVDHRREYAVG